MLETLYSPESLGISSKGIAEMINTIAAARNNMHGFIILRHGKKIAEAYSPEFGVDSKHRMYSVSKSFTSAAIGILAGEGKISLNDRVCTFFPERCPADMPEEIKEATIRDLLMMATPFNETTYYIGAEDWTKTFFNTAPSHRPGTLFNYDTSATLVLDAIIYTVTGKQFEEYLYEKALKFAGWEKAPRCVKAPEGISWGGSGVLCSLRELASFSQLFLDGGKAPDGTQCIPADYVKEATKKQISNETNNDFSYYGGYGYGYQIWVTKLGYAFLGMGNQLSIFVPEKDLLFCCISDDQGNDGARDVIFESLERFVLNTAADSPLPEDENGRKSLEEAYKLLKMPLPRGTAHSVLENEINGKEFKMKPNRMEISSVRFDFDKENGAMTLGTPRGERKITFGLGFFDDSVFPETHYAGEIIDKPLGRGYRCHTAGVWDEPCKLILRCFITDDYLGNFTATVSFKDGKPNFYFLKTAEWFLNEYRGFAEAE